MLLFFFEPFIAADIKCRRWDVSVELKKNWASGCGSALRTGLWLCLFVSLLYFALCSRFCLFTFVFVAVICVFVSVCHVIVSIICVFGFSFVTLEWIFYLFVHFLGLCIHFYLSFFTLFCLCKGFLCCYFLVVLPVCGDLCSLWEFHFLLFLLFCLCSFSDIFRTLYVNLDLFCESSCLCAVIQLAHLLAWSSSLLQKTKTKEGIKQNKGLSVWTKVITEVKLKLDLKTLSLPLV